MSSYGTADQLRNAQARYDNMAPEDDDVEDTFPEVEHPTIIEMLSVYLTWCDIPWFVTADANNKIKAVNVNGSWFDAKYTLGTELIRDLEWALKDKLAKEAKEAGK